MAAGWMRLRASGAAWHEPLAPGVHKRVARAVMELRWLPAQIMPAKGEEGSA